MRTPSNIRLARLPGPHRIFFFLTFALLFITNSPLFSQQKGEFKGKIAVDSTGTFFLSHKYVDPNTLTLQFDEESIDYQFDPSNNSIHVLSEISVDSILVRYLYLPLELEESFQLHQLVEHATYDSTAVKEGRTYISRTREELRTTSAFSNLRRQGSIMRGIQVGTGKDVSLESGLHLSLEGKLARDIEVRALLDDQSLPIQPEGTSSRLSELDQVYIDIKSGKTRGRFGDYHLQQKNGRYGTFDRKLEGAIVNYRNNNIKVQASGAVTKAIFHTNTFNGLDGVQGPYRLTGREGEQNFIVLGGSEKVWIDGKRQRRGQNNDYTIDYNRGEITFTPGQPISSESRIVIDFEYVPDAFPRNLYSGSLNYQSDDKRYKAGFSFVQEGDDYKNPINFEMTDNYEKQLREAGDTSEPIYLSSAQFLGNGKADYLKQDSVWVNDGLSYEIYVFVQPDENGNAQGQWSVLYSEVGPGKGDYSRVYDISIGNYRFEWIGPGLGEWAPVRIVSLPERHRHSAFTFEANPNRLFSLKSDFGVSDYDPNVLSKNNNEDNIGLAQNYEVTFSPIKTKTNRTPLSVSYNYRDEGARYLPFGRTSDVEYGRSWGQDSLRTNQKVKQQEASLLFTPIDNLNFSSSYASLEQGDKNGSSYFESDRVQFNSNFTSRTINYNSSVERIISDDKASTNHSDWTRANGLINTTLARLFTPGLEGEMEKRKSKFVDNVYGGFRYNRLKSFLSIGDYVGHSGTLHYQIRNRDKQVGGDSFIKNYDEYSTGILWGFRKPTSDWRSSVELLHTEKDFKISDSTDVTTDLAELRAGWMPYNGALSTDFTYQLSKTVTRPSALIAYQVPTGQGDYIRIGDEYIYDPEIGDIVLIPEPTGEALPTTDLGTSLHLDWSPHRLPDGKGIVDGFGWEDISLVTDVQIREVTRWDNASDIYLLNLSKFLSDSTIEGNLSWRQDVHFFRPSEIFNLRIRYSAQKRKNNLYGTGSDNYGQDSWELRLQNRLAEQLDLESNGEYKRRNKKLSSANESDYFTLYRLSSKLSWRYSRSWRYTLQVRGLLDSEKGIAEDVTGIGVKPGLSWAIRDRGRITADFEALWITTQRDDLPYDLADGRPKGRNGRIGLRADYRLGRYISMRAIYNSRLDQDKKPIHLARLEVTSSF